MQTSNSPPMARAYVVARVDCWGHSLRQQQVGTSIEAHKLAREWAAANPRHIVRVYQEIGYWSGGPSFRRFDTPQQKSVRELFAEYFVTP